MKIKIDKSTLANALLQVLPFAPQKSPISILKYAKVTTKGNRVKIEANNTSSSIRKYIEAIEIDQDGSFLIDIASVSALVSNIKDGVISLNVEGDTMSIEHIKGWSESSTMPVDEYPDLDMPSDSVTEFSIPGANLSECVSIGKNFVGTDEFKPVLKTIYAYIKDGKFGYCATDTRFLVHDFNDIDGVDGKDVSWYIEPMIFSAIIKNCNNDEKVLIKVTPKAVSYRFGNTIIESVQTQGNFPNFERVIPKTWAMECSVDKSDLVDSLSRITLTADDSRLTKIDIHYDDMTLSSSNLVESKTSSENIKHNGCNGELTIGVHADFLKKSISACASNEISLRLTSSAAPILIHQSTKPNATILLMPMTLKS